MAIRRISNPLQTLAAPQTAAGARSSLQVVDQAAPPEERADAARNRQKILKAARRLLGRRTICQLSMDEVAAAAGVGKGTLYRRFTDRASLCHALLDESERDLQTRALGGMGLAPDAPAALRLEALLEAMADFVLENAEILAEVEKHLASPQVRHQHPTREWRRTVLVRLARLLPAADGLSPHAQVLRADAVLCMLDPQMARFWRSQGVPDEDIARTWCHAALRALGVTPDKPGTPMPQ